MMMMLMDLGVISSLQCFTRSRMRAALTVRGMAAPSYRTDVFKVRV